MNIQDLIPYAKPPDDFKYGDENLGANKHEVDRTDHAQNIENHLDVEQLVSKLNPRDRIMVCLYYGLDDYGSLSTRELAEIFGMSFQAISMNLRRILCLLKNMVKV